jgi:hypothetical protein
MQWQCHGPGPLELFPCIDVSLQFEVARDSDRITQVFDVFLSRHAADSEQDVEKCPTSTHGSGTCSDSTWRKYTSLAALTVASHRDWHGSSWTRILPRSRSFVFQKAHWHQVQVKLVIRHHDSQVVLLMACHRHGLSRGNSPRSLSGLTVGQLELQVGFKLARLGSHGLGTVALEHAGESDSRLGTVTLSLGPSQ